MSWLRPDKVPHSDYNPQEVVKRRIGEYGELGTAVLEVFNEVDPLHAFFGENADEYVGYAERFFKNLGNRDFKTLTDKEVEDLVRSSFHRSQIEKGFVTEENIEAIVHGIIAVQHPHP